MCLYCTSYSFFYLSCMLLISAQYSLILVQSFIYLDSAAGHIAYITTTPLRLKLKHILVQILDLIKIFNQPNSPLPSWVVTFLGNTLLEFSMLNLFSTSSMYIFYKRSSIILDLSLQTFIPRIQDTSSTSFIENLLDNHLLIEISIEISFSVRRMSSTYSTKNVTALPLIFL